MNGYRHRSGALSTTLGAVAALVAMLSLAGPATAHHGSRGDKPAGEIAFFDRDSGKLVIDLVDGGAIAGIVTRFTWIEGDDECDRERRLLHGWGCRRLSDSEHDDRGWRHRGDVEDLVEGATVEDALLILKDGRAFYAKVELAD